MTASRLRDAVTYAVKDNSANGEDNRDGNAHEPTWPGGDVRALLATLFLSRGTPMLTAGDEFGRTQGGNNNAYAQDNAITWLDWETADQRLIGFTAALAELRRALAAFLPDRFLTGEAADGSRFPDAQWFGADGSADELGRSADAEVLGLVLSAGSKRLALVFNRSSTNAASACPHREAAIAGRGCSAPPRAPMFHPPPSPSSPRSVSRRRALPTTKLATLAAAAGIEREWWEVDGTHHRVSLDTQRALASGHGAVHRECRRRCPRALARLSEPGPLVATAGERDASARPPSAAAASCSLTSRAASA